VEAKNESKFGSSDRSLSVANSFDFGQESFKLSQFQGSEGATKYIRTIDNLYDAMNSCNPLGKGTKAPKLFFRIICLLE
jgi:hypothetical protein